ncbi:MAG: hypothetical protein CO029_02665 [Candidatus Magasanikbacteria bacterium CG_4_9_14_0_2_um_filter_41_10]|uniref:HEPN domain-containing protein n=1 Tax=Candidatus Magasanikbacteria bacterium CG_4_10_14_0_2_um_filter_41_31 TaxID=1974639 RepID=A0A2M7V2Y4_9BACT|nr:MAG: hypothetical protein AUJ37_03830 [Candidatus Magasanikbacteria bacterium CG1_02_41_34]PIZ92827.1 MAG: hypothetical protein COX83_03515 [Candidatus Magasanikbacteria bacterium CG_4_10_14_0_2_um_filter_41_31]PJC53437.1 MAG: hypothetical protein CO029_02665 [Candidatus Magasanikbacteria bacterium CG_4_9_14_0_2_um_filter_41_10]
MKKYTLKAETAEILFSHIGFLNYSKNFLDAEKPIVVTKKEFNPVPYFLICKSIELSLKAYQIQIWFYTKREQLKEKYDGKLKNLLKNRYGHNLNKRLEDILTNSEIFLPKSEVLNIRRANTFYDVKNKTFEFANVGFAGNGFTKLADEISANGNKQKGEILPELNLLRNSAKKLIEQVEREIKKG